MHIKYTKCTFLLFLMTFFFLSEREKLNVSKMCITHLIKMTCIMYDSRSSYTKSHYEQRHFTELHSSKLTQLQTRRTWDRREWGEKKEKHNFIIVVMSGEKDLCGGSDPGSVAYLQTCSSNTSGQVISYTLIPRDDLISPIRERQCNDSQGLSCQFCTTNWTSWVNLIWTVCSNIQGQSLWTIPHFEIMK